MSTAGKCLAGPRLLHLRRPWDFATPRRVIRANLWNPATEPDEASKSRRTHDTNCQMIAS
jgi:hypothetical protein